MNNFKTIIKKILFVVFKRFSFLRALVRNVLDTLAKISIQTSKWVGNMYTILFDFLGTSWYDHRFDHLRGIDNYHWLERVFFVLPKISEDDSVLDIGCGDGIYSGVFYSEKAKSVFAIDTSQDSITSAIKHYKRNNVRFLKKNLLTWDVPANKYDVVVMFSVIEHLTALDGQKVLPKIKKSLKKGGVFFGSTPIVQKLGVSNWEHKNEFTSIAEVKTFLMRVFKDVKITESLWNKDRPECYFECKA